MAVLTREHEPPACGPYSRPVWCPAAGRWRRRLTDEGKALAAAYLAEYPRPGLVVRSHFYGLWVELRRRGFAEDEVHQAAAEGVVAAVATFDPAKAGGPKGLKTHCVWHIRAWAQRLLSGWSAPVLSLDAVDPWGPSGPAAPDDGREQAARDREQLRLLFRRLRRCPPRIRRAVKLKFGIGCRPVTLAEGGAAFGVSKERFRQLVGKGLERLREAAG